MSDLRVLKDDTLLDSGTSADSDTGANADIGTKLGGWMNLSSGVDEDGRDDVDTGLSELVAASLGGLLEVEGVGRDGRASGLDLTPEVLGLIDEELLAVGHIAENILLETNDFILLVALVVVILLRDVAVLKIIGGGVGDEARGAVEAALNRRSNGGEDGFGGEEVDTAVDKVADLRLGLLDVVEDTASVSIGDDATEVVGGFVAHSGAQDNSLGVLLNEELEHLVQRERAADIGIEHKEALGPALEDGISEVVQTASGAQSLVLAEVLDGDGGELLGGVLDEVTEDGLVVVADDVNLLDLFVGNAGDGGEAVPDDGVAGHFEERFGDVER